VPATGMNARHPRSHHESSRTWQLAVLSAMDGAASLILEPMRRMAPSPFTPIQVSRFAMDMEAQGVSQSPTTVPETVEACRGSRKRLLLGRNAKSRPRISSLMI